MNLVKQITPAQFQILLCLADGPKHGYAIMQEINAIPDNQVRLGPGTLYGNLKKMMAAELIVESHDHLDPTETDQRRRYYRLTDRGMQVLSAEVQRLQELLRIAQTKELLSGIA